jgi:hypothetical protein
MRASKYRIFSISERGCNMRSVTNAVVLIALAGVLQMEDVRLRRPAASDPTIASLTASEPTWAIVSAPPPPTPEPDGCAFVLGFAELRELVGAERVGDCLEDEQAGENGDIIQATAHGIFVWRALDNVGAFNDGQHTWLHGPGGLQRRLNNERLAWEVAWEGPVLPRHRVLTYYGNPLSTSMGILGEQPRAAMLEQFRQQLQAYADADPERPIVGALELIATVAQEMPGPGALYRLQMEDDVIDQVAGWAESNGYLLILDVQPGRSTFEAEVPVLLPYLRRPYVHLALDPEFAMRPGKRPGEEIGTVDAATVNRVIQLLSDLVEQENLPPKLLVVHRFTELMVTNAGAIKPTPQVQVVVTMDGFGAPAAKQSKYEWLVRDQRVQFAGFKLFYRQDTPLLTPREVIDLDPSLDLIIYQ